MFSLFLLSLFFILSLVFVSASHSIEKLPPFSVSLTFPTTQSVSSPPTPLFYYFFCFRVYLLLSTKVTPPLSVSLTLPTTQSISSLPRLIYSHHHHHHHVTLPARISLNPLLPPVSIVHHSREVFEATTCLGTELLYIGSSWSSCLSSSMWRVPQEYVTNVFVLTSPALPPCLVHLTLIVFMMGGRWPYNYCFVGCYIYIYIHDCIIIITSDRLPSRLGLQNTAFLQRGKTPTQRVSRIWYNIIRWWGSSNAGVLGNALPGPLWPWIVAPD